MNQPPIQDRKQVETEISFLVRDYGMKEVLNALIAYVNRVNDHNEGYLNDLSDGLRCVVYDYDNRYKKYPEEEWYALHILGTKYS